MRCGRCLRTGFSLVVASGELICDNCALGDVPCGPPLTGPPTFAARSRGSLAVYAPCPGSPGRDAQLDGTRFREVDRPLAALALIVGRSSHTVHSLRSSHSWTFLTKLIAS